MLSKGHSCLLTVILVSYADSVSSQSSLIYSLENIVYNFLIFCFGAV